MSSFVLASFLNYPHETNDWLLTRLSEIVTELSNLYEEIAMIEADEIRDKAHVLNTCGETSSSGRRDRVSMEVVEAPATRTTLIGHRDALIEEKFFIIRILDSRR